MTRRPHPSTESITVRLDRWASMLRNELADLDEHLDNPEDWDDLELVVLTASNWIADHWAAANELVKLRRQLEFLEILADGGKITVNGIPWRQAWETLNSIVSDPVISSDSPLTPDTVSG